MRKSKMKLYDLCLTGIFTALIVIMAQISIPMPLGVPMTMQTFAISLAGVVLGARRGFAAALAYILLGAVGIPVFAGFAGGAGIVAGPTGGFLLSFPAMAWLIGLGAEQTATGGRLGKRGPFLRKWGAALGLFAGTAVNYLCGMVFFSLVTHNSIRAAFFACVLPFLPTAVLKAAAAGIIGIRLQAAGVALR